MDDLLSEFLTETNESLSVLDIELVKLEQNPNDPELLSNIFRLVHTIKGTCGFLGLPRLEALAHASENVLGKIRDGELPVTPAAVTLILESLDAIKSILATLEATEAEPEGDDAALIARLNGLANGAVVAAPKAAKPKKPVKSEEAPLVAAAPSPAVVEVPPAPVAAEAPKLEPVQRHVPDPEPGEDEPHAEVVQLSRVGEDAGKKNEESKESLVAAQ